MEVVILDARHRLPVALVALGAAEAEAGHQTADSCPETWSATPARQEL